MTDDAQDGFDYSPLGQSWWDSNRQRAWRIGQTDQVCGQQTSRLLQHEGG